MKTIVKISGMIALMVLVVLSPMSCRKEDRSRMTVKMKDAPAAYSEVNVDVRGLEINTETKGWTSLDVRAGVYNLLELQNDVTVVLVDKAEIPLGKINQIRLVLGSNNTVVDASGSHTLIVPSGEETGLKVNIGKVIIPNREIEVVLDFDANASVVVEGNGTFLLKPVVKVESVVMH